MSFDLVVWAMQDGASGSDVRTAQELCRQGHRAPGSPEPRIVSFYRAVTAAYPDRVAAPGSPSPWEVSPLHVRADHIEMNLTETCPDEVLLTIERLAGEHGLQLLDLQDGSVYPPPARIVR